MTAHPRSRGENPPPSTLSRCVYGSSPLTRGKHLQAHRIDAQPGLIPAHAGKTGSVVQAGGARAAHPRSRGENHALASTASCEVGSSPLTRGKRVGFLPGDLAAGLIPAHAGKTHMTTKGEALASAHPRSRGENPYARLARRCGRGSSPLTRGKPRRTFPSTWTGGLIPAHAGKTSASWSRTAAGTAHPRSRGENPEIWSASILESGSSPLTRGKRRRVGVGRRRGRLIPAHAGKTPGSARCGAQRPAHPRSRGENVPRCSLPRRRRGSSPLTRGKRLERDRRHRDERLIPAHAGKTQPAPSRNGVGAAHPRSRGENPFERSRRALIDGSSPLTRGKRGRHMDDRPRRRLIPAHAGKTPLARWPRGPRQAHPRSRGENGGDLAHLEISTGSSPLTRGKHASGGGDSGAERLIPAHAGKTAGVESRSRSRRAHPRSRGENCRRALLAGRLRGSSPLTRGKPLPERGLRLRRGLIPAHAGKTVGKCGDLVPLAAHPRSRGENYSNNYTHIDSLGSSPLTRGKRPQGDAPVGEGRLIPAHAGKTMLGEAAVVEWEAHPRSRGENETTPAMTASRIGSSPLTRGKPLLWSRAYPGARLIPAHAGKTQSTVDIVVDAPGSSPLTRGKPPRARRPSH